MGDPQLAHEVILGEPLPPSNFVRRMLSRWDLALCRARALRWRRPARLYHYVGPRDP